VGDIVARRIGIGIGCQSCITHTPRGRAEGEDEEEGECSCRKPPFLFSGQPQHHQFPLTRHPSWAEGEGPRTQDEGEPRTCSASRRGGRFGNGREQKACGKSPLNDLWRQNAATPEPRATNKRSHKEHKELQQEQDEAATGEP